MFNREPEHNIFQYIFTAFQLRGNRDFKIVVCIIQKEIIRSPLSENVEIYIYRGCNSVASNNCLGRLYILLAYTVFGVFINLVVIRRILYALPFISYSWQRLEVRKNQ